MAAKPKSEFKEPSEQVANPLVMTISQLLALTDEEKNNFRSNGGTVCEDPQ
jgi:hypothetical protein